MAQPTSLHRRLESSGVIIVVMGVSGSGKTTLAKALAGRLGWPYIEADDFHPKANVTKMHDGQPLDEKDRAPWLAAVHAQLFDIAAAGRDAVLACSALKAAHRTALAEDIDDVHFVFLQGDPDLIDERLRQRREHFMPARLLGTQLAALEPPDDAFEVPMDLSTAAQAQRVIDALITPRR